MMWREWVQGNTLRVLAFSLFVQAAYCVCVCVCVSASADFELGNGDGLGRLMVLDIYFKPFNVLVCILG